ncbi:MAG: hypothetical protein JWM43_21 [Acidobacteriaceae bacterium]|nr:hypothetical protein [Acidobacteriaceae bacterium]
MRQRRRGIGWSGFWITVYEVAEPSYLIELLTVDCRLLPRSAASDRFTPVSLRSLLHIRLPALADAL